MAPLNARQRRKMITWHLTHGQRSTATCAQFGVSRATLYRWLARCAADPQHPLRDQSRRPHTIRRPGWSRVTLVRLCTLMLAQPTWGRTRLTLALHAAIREAPPGETYQRLFPEADERFDEPELYDEADNFDKPEVLPSSATVGRMLAHIRRRCPICHGQEGRHDAALHALETDLTHSGIHRPLALTPPDPAKTAQRREKAALRREKIGILREADALLRTR